MKILIIGAGILGANLAFQLARAGADVTVLESAVPAAAASGRSFGWINASFFANPDHHRLRVAGMAAHHRLSALLPRPAPNWQGALWFEDEGPGFEVMQADLACHGYPVAALTGDEVRALEPALRAAPGRALRFGGEGAMDAAEMTRALLAASAARVLSGVAAKSLIEVGGQITGARTAIGPVLADHVIVAAGVASPLLLQSVELVLPMLTRPGLILRTQPVNFRVNHILVTPDQEIRQLPDGSLIAPCAANHQGDMAQSVPDAAGAVAATLERLRALFGRAEIALARSDLGWRPVPGDGLPVVGLAAPGLSVAVMHSGVTLAALIGERLCAEVLGQGAEPLFAPYRLDRFH